MIVAGALVGVPVGTYFLTRLDPVTTRWIISGFVAALLALLLSGWRYRGKDHRRSRSPSAAFPASAAGWRRPAARRSSATGWDGRSPAKIARANIVLFFGASDLFSMVSYAASGLITWDSLKLSLLVGPIYAVGVGFGASLFGRASETVFRTICYALIAIAVIAGLPALDGVLGRRIGFLKQHEAEEASR